MVRRSIYMPVGASDALTSAIARIQGALLVEGHRVDQAHIIAALLTEGISREDAALAKLRQQL